MIARNYTHSDDNNMSYTRLVIDAETWVEGRILIGNVDHYGIS